MTIGAVVSGAAIGPQGCPGLLSALEQSQWCSQEPGEAMVKYMQPPYCGVDMQAALHNWYRAGQIPVACLHMDNAIASLPGLWNCVSAAHAGIWLKCGGMPCQEEHRHSQMHATRPLSASPCHQQSSQLQTLHGKAAWKMGENFCIRYDSGLWYIAFLNIYFSDLINVLFEEKYCNWPIFHKI